MDQLSADELAAQLFAMDVDDVADGTEETIGIESNAGGSAQVAPYKEDMTVLESVIAAGINPQDNFQYMVDGVEVSPDEIVAPGSQIYIHTVVEGGWPKTWPSNFATSSEPKCGLSSGPHFPPLVRGRWSLRWGRSRRLGIKVSPADEPLLNAGRSSRPSKLPWIAMKAWPPRSFTPVGNTSPVRMSLTNTGWCSLSAM